MTDQRSTDALPLFERLQIESQSHCNRSCWFCPRTFDRSGTYLSSEGEPAVAQMPTEKIVDLLDQARAMGFRGLVGFHNYSEPLLDKRNLDLAHAAAERGLQPYLHTNGDVLKDNEELCNRASEVYRLIVVGLYDYATNEELAAAKNYWVKRLPVERLEFSAIGLQGARSARSTGVPRALVPSDERMAIPDLTYARAACHRPLIRMIVRYDGEMCNCCEDIFGAFDLGNVYEHSIEELWYSKTHAEIANRLISGEREQYALCRRCPMSPTASAGAGQVNIARRHVTQEEVQAWSASRFGT